MDPHPLSLRLAWRPQKLERTGKRAFQTKYSRGVPIGTELLFTGAEPPRAAFQPTVRKVLGRGIGVSTGSPTMRINYKGPSLCIGIAVFGANATVLASVSFCAHVSRKWAANLAHVAYII